MPVLLHVSDLHFGPPHNHAVAGKLLELAHELAPDIIVASGDFTQRATEKQFMEARAWLDRLPQVPVIVCPGNHDVPLYRVHERLRTPHALYKKHIAPELNSVHSADGVTIVSLDSTSPRRAITNGRVSRRQLNFAENAFAQSADSDLRIVVAHHPFAIAPDYESGASMPRAKRAIDAFTRQKVDLILGGHLHRAYVGNSLDVYPGNRDRQGIVIVQSGTSSSTRGRARERSRNTFNLIDIQESSIRVTPWMYQPELERFEPIAVHVLPRPGRAYLDESDWKCEPRS